MLRGGEACSLTAGEVHDRASCRVIRTGSSKTTAGKDAASPWLCGLRPVCGCCDWLWPISRLQTGSCRGRQAGSGQACSAWPKPRLVAGSAL
eukprot:1312376-Pyramimonas_sp.AAC.1